MGRGLGGAPPFSAFARQYLYNSVFSSVYLHFADAGTKFFDSFGKRGASFCGRGEVKAASLEWNRAMLLLKGMSSEPLVL